VEIDNQLVMNHLLGIDSLVMVIDGMVTDVDGLMVVVEY